MLRVSCATTLQFDFDWAQGSIVGQQRTDITEKLSESERLMKEMSQTWEEKLVKTERLQHERQQALEKMGISVQASGIQVEKSKYYLVNLNDDPSLNELLVYYLKVCTYRYMRIVCWPSLFKICIAYLCPFRKGPS